MKKTVLCLFFIFCSLFFVPFVTAVSYLTPTGFVNDFAGIYSAGFKTQLENNLSDFEKQTGAEIAVVTIKSLEGENLEDYAVRLFEQWKIGKKGTDNGLLLLISKEDRKIRIEVGYGLEPYITDGRAGEIIRNQMSPEFKKENYEAGTLAAVTQIEKYISDKDIAPKTAGQSKSSDDLGGLIAFGIIIFYIIAAYIASYLGRTKEIWQGGIFGGVLGGIGGLIFLSVIGLIFGAILFGGVGLLLDFILTKNFQARKKKGLPTDFFHTFGGFGGGGWGGGSGGGGFGGGSSGGGGGSGGW